LEKKTGIVSETSNKLIEPNIQYSLQDHLK
jgi:hypothetical protein